MPTSMQHWNGNQVCAIDIETTGLDPHWHEIIQLAIIPLDSEFKPRKDILPFDIFIKPLYPERIDPESFKVHKKTLIQVQQFGFDPETAKDLLEEWINKLGLPLNASGFNRCKIIPLGHNYLAFEYGFIRRWLSIDQYEEWFHFHPRDTMIAALYLNDHAAFHAEKVPYPKVSLSYLCNLLNVELLTAHDALSDAVATAEIYRKLCQIGLIA